MSLHMRSRRMVVVTCLITAALVAACSSTDAPLEPLTLAPTYHLRAIDGVPLPIAEGSSESLDSGHAIRKGGDTVRLDTYSHSPPAGGNPGIAVIALGTWHARQS